MFEHSQITITAASALFALLTSSYLSLACGGRFIEDSVESNPVDSSGPIPGPIATGDTPSNIKSSPRVTCKPTHETQAACWGFNERWWVDRTSVDYSTCSDDGRAFVDGLSHEWDCYRGSNVDHAATVWCCQR